MTISDIYGDSPSLFSEMVSLGAPWDSDIGQSMDIAYFNMYSGIKLPTAFLLSNVNGDSLNMARIANIVFSYYSKQWERLWNAFVAEYNPLSPYSYEETREGESDTSGTTSSIVNYTDKREGNETRENSSVIDSTTANTGTVKNVVEESTTNSSTSSGERETSTTATSTETIESTVSLTHGETISKSIADDFYRYGFNSEEKVPTESKTVTETDVHSGTDTTETNTTDSTTSKNDVTDTTSGKVDENGSKISDGTLTNNLSEKTDTTNTENGTVSNTLKESGDSSNNGTQDVNMKTTMTVTRKGNIGGVTMQELLGQEFDLWKWSFFSRVFEDTDKFLALSVISYI